MADHELDQHNARQRRADLQRYYPPNFVPADRVEIVRPAGPVQHQVDLRVPQQAIQVVEVRTSATDRAKGFSIATGQLSAVIGLAIVAVLWWGFDMPLISMGAVVVFVVVYAIVWSAAWFWHNLMSAEGVSLVSALLMWLYLFREQDKKDR
jgi:hypothetical protein